MELLRRCTSEDGESVVPGFIIEELSRRTSVSVNDCLGIAESLVAQLSVRASKYDAQNKCKVLRSMRLLCEKNTTNPLLRQCFQKRAAEIKKLLSYTSPVVDPLTGDAITKQVRLEAERCLKTIYESFSTPAAPDPTLVSFNQELPLSSRIEGFGNAAFPQDGKSNQLNKFGSFPTNYGGKYHSGGGVGSYNPHSASLTAEQLVERISSAAGAVAQYLPAPMRQRLDHVFEHNPSRFPVGGRSGVRNSSSAAYLDNYRFSVSSDVLSPPPSLYKPPSSLEPQPFNENTERVSIETQIRSLGCLIEEVCSSTFTLRDFGPNSNSLNKLLEVLSAGGGSSLVVQLLLAKLAITYENDHDHLDDHFGDDDPTEVEGFRQFLSVVWGTGDEAAVRSVVKPARTWQAEFRVLATLRISVEEPASESSRELVIETLNRHQNFVTSLLEYIKKKRPPKCADAAQWLLNFLQPSRVASSARKEDTSSTSGNLIDLLGDDAIPTSTKLIPEKLPPPPSPTKSLIPESSSSLENSLLDGVFGSNEEKKEGLFSGLEVQSQSLLDDYESVFNFIK